MHRLLITTATLLSLASAAAMAQPAATTACTATSGDTVRPVIELYTSEGCSSCPPADRWLSQWSAQAGVGRGAEPVIQAFHVTYWDRLGWPDRFATAAYTARQHQVAEANHLRYVYTPQLVLNGRDWRDWARTSPGTIPSASAAGNPAKARLRLERLADGRFVAEVQPLASAGAEPWVATWTAVEHGHSSRVKAGENSGATLRHDHVVRELHALGPHVGRQELRLMPAATEGGRPTQINLVVQHPGTRQIWQALTLTCPASRPT